ncbi:MAG: hypothetical protein DIU69_01240 [Bacillota bacterium]|nr:MAG: hypothetical protein DIU69_01240 [Bacillota bacterium]
MDRERRLTGDPAPGARVAARFGTWPAWADAAGRVIVRVVIGALVALVMVQTWASARQVPLADAYGPVLRGWSLDPDMAAALAFPEGQGESAGPPGTAGAVAPDVPAAATGAGRKEPTPFVVTLHCEGPGPVLVRLDGERVARLRPGETRPVAVRPGQRLELWPDAAAGGRVRVTYASPGLAEPRAGRHLAVGMSPVTIGIRARDGS